jgi:hypothetical protein
MGKTTLAKTIKESTIILSFEGGTLSLSDADIAMIDCTVDEAGKTLSEKDRLKKLFDALEWLGGDEAKKKYKCVFVDSITEIGDCLLKVLEPQFEGNKNKFEIWQVVAKKMENIIRTLRDIPHYDVVFTALEKAPREDDKSGVIRPALPGQAATTKLQAALDEIFRYTFAEGARVLQCQAAPGVMAKDRRGKLSAQEKPDLGLIFEKIKRGGKEK